MTEGRVTIPTLDLALLLLNVLTIGALLVLMVLRGPSVPTVLLTVGAVGMAVAKLGRAFLGAKGAA